VTSDPHIVADSATPVTQPRVAGPGRTFKRLASLTRSRVAMLILFDGVIFATVGIIEPGFASLSNVKVLVDGMALQAIVAAAMAALLAGGRFDLSVDGVAALSGIVTAKLMLNLGLSAGEAIPLGLMFGAAIGLCQGMAVELFGFNPIVISLAFWWITSGVSSGITANTIPSTFSHTFSALGQDRLAGFALYDYYALVLIALAWFVLRHTRFGYHVFATGGDRESSRLKGIRVHRVGILLYMATATAAALAGIVFAASIDSAQPAPLNGMALNVIAAAVIGGAALNGGRASIVGTVLGLFLLNMLTNASIFLNISSLWEQAISGVVLASAVMVDAISERESHGERSPFRLPRLLAARLMGSNADGTGSGRPTGDMAHR
jgi:ribose transport system permease protein